MVEEPSHVKQLSLNHVCKIGLMWYGPGSETKTFPKSEPEYNTVTSVSPRADLGNINS
jgi:hypothetical protein